jgi:DNA-binding beta-propeller fold protein YncE
MSKVFRSAAVLAALVASACSSRPPTAPSRFRGPTAIVRVSAITHKKPGEVRDYLAVASSRGDELRLLDPSDDQPVPGPVVLYALSIATAPKPMQLASASLFDGGPDVLVVASEGQRKLQLVSTWEDADSGGGGSAGSNGNRVIREIDLEPIAPGTGAILCLRGAPVPSGLSTGIPPSAIPVPGKARILVGLAGGKLVVIEFGRQAGAIGSVVDVASSVQDLGFDPVDLSVSPDNRHVYAATSDTITGTDGKSAIGVAEIDASPPTAAVWTVRALDARGPTRAVAAGFVEERFVDDPEHFDPTPLPKVFAALDIAGCGLDRPIPCGIVTLDPASGGLAPDPVQQMPWRAPMPVPGIPLGIVLLYPPQNGTQQRVSTDLGIPQHQMLLAPGSGQRWTPQAAAVPSSDGRVYILDIGRWQPPNDVSLLNGDTRAHAKAAYAVDPLGQAIAAGGIGLRKLTVKPGDPDDVTLDGATLATRLGVTAGFTATDQWRVVWQGQLPGLTLRQAVLGTLPTGETWLAIQERRGNGWVAHARLGDPVSGLRAGDIVQLFSPEGATCTDIAEVRIAGFLPPDPQSFPGGAVSLGVNAGACWQSGLSPGGTIQAVANFRTADWLLYGASTGYAGRPELDKLYSLEWQDEDPLAVRCTTDRAACETLAVARKARRLYYPSDLPCAKLNGGTPAVGCYPDWPELADPLLAGPALSLRLGLATPVCADDSSCPGSICDTGRGQCTPLRDSGLFFSTQSGIVFMSRYPQLGGSLPWAGTFVDRSRYAGHADQGPRAYVTYAGSDAVIEFSPGETLGEVLNIY